MLDYQLIYQLVYLFSQRFTHSLIHSINEQCICLYVCLSTICVHPKGNLDGLCLLRYPCCLVPFFADLLTYLQCHWRQCFAKCQTHQDKTGHVVWMNGGYKIRNSRFEFTQGTFGNPAIPCTLAIGKCVTVQWE